MRRLFTIFALALWGLTGLMAANCYRLYLRDKAGSTYCELSERSLVRREAQGIALDDTDLTVSPLYLTQLQAKGWEIVTQSRWLNTVVVRRKDGAQIADSEIRALDFVTDYEMVSDEEPAAKPSKLTLTSPRDTQTSFRQPVWDMKGETLLEAGFMGQDKLIAVLDGGFLMADVNLNAKHNIVGWRDMYSADPDDDTAIFGGDAHGARALSVMMADAESGVWGTAPAAQYFLIRTEHPQTETPLEEDMWVAGAELADSVGADIVSSSLGYYNFDNALFNHTKQQLTTGEVFVSRGAKIAATKGMLICTAAGNDRTNSWCTIDFPSDVENVLTVGSLSSDGVPAYFSSPGFTSPYVKPDVACLGVNVPVIEPERGVAAKQNGTSFSTPMVAGLCASLWSALPELTSEDIRMLVRESAYYFFRPDSLRGYGIPDFAEALRCGLVLAGRPGGASIMAPSSHAEDRDRSLPLTMIDLTGRRVRLGEKNEKIYLKKDGQTLLLLR